MKLSNKIAYKSWKIMLSMLSGIIKGVLKGFYHSVGARGVKLMIKNNWHTIPLALVAFTADKWKYPPELTEQEIYKLEQLRKNTAPTILYALSIARQIIAGLPRQLIEEKLTRDWMLKKLSEIDPSITKTIIETEGGMEWLEEEIRLLKKFLYGEK